MFIDVHEHTSTTAESVRALHEAGLATQRRYGVSYLRCWPDEERDLVMCLVRAPSRDAAAAVHHDAHGAPGRLVEVREGE